MNVLMAECIQIRLANQVYLVALYIANAAPFGYLLHLSNQHIILCANHSELFFFNVLYQLPTQKYTPHLLDARSAVLMLL